MDPDALKAMYRRWLLEEWGQGSYAVADELIAGDLIDHNPLPGQPPGRAGEVWTAKMIRKAFPDAAFEADVVVSDGDYVIGRWTMTATNTGPFDLFGLPPTGRPVTMTGQEIFRVRDGRFAEVWHQEDVGGMLTQLGLEPPPFMLRLAAQRSARQYRRQQAGASAPDAPSSSQRRDLIEGSFSVRISRSPELVFAVLTDFERYLARWARGPIAARKLTAGTGVGARFMVTAKAGPIKVSAPYQVTRWDPPHRFGGSGIAGPVAFDEQYVLTPTDTGTELTQSMSARPRGPLRIAGPIMRRQLGRLITGDLERLAALVEAETSPARPPGTSSAAT